MPRVRHRPATLAGGPEQDEDPLMQITVSGKQVDLSDALRTRVADQLDHIAGKYFDHALEANVTFSRARSFFTCDINVHAGRGLTLRGEGEAADANSAFDDAAEHIAKRLRRYRRRVNEHSRDVAQKERPQAARQYTLRQEDEDADAATAQPNGVIQAATYATVIAETAAEISSLTVSDAVMRMDLADQQVLMFRNSATGILNVVYRRNDGHIGWIDPAAAG
jgi:ribosomal subunit interface protein